MSKSDIIIGDATADNIPRIVELDQSISGSTKPEFWLHDFHRQSDDANSIFPIARLDGNVAGYITGKVRTWEFGSPSAGWIYAIGVAEQYRNLGVGTLLFDSIKQFFQSFGTQTVRTMLHIDDHLLMSFFRFQGLSAGPFIELDVTQSQKDVSLDSSPAILPERTALRPT